MQTWKKVILGIIAFLFILTFSLTLTWYSISNSLLNSETYKPVVPLIMNSFMNNTLGSNNNLNLDQDSVNSITLVANTWIEDTFACLNGRTNNLELSLPEDNILKPLLMQVTLSQLKNMPEANLLTQEQINTLVEQNYPQMKIELQTQLNDIQLKIEPQILELRNAINLAKTVALISLILSIIFALTAILIIRQIRNIMNWFGTNFLISAGPLFVISLALTTSIKTILASMELPLEMVNPITTIVTSMFSSLMIFSGIFVVLGITLLLVKFAFKKEEQTQN